MQNSREEIPGCLFLMATAHPLQHESPYRSLIKIPYIAFVDVPPDLIEEDFMKRCFITGLFFAALTLLISCSNSFTATVESDSGSRALNQLEATLETETMTRGGSYAGIISTPFAGVALYANGDKASGTVSFAKAPGVYRLDIRGASNNANAAAASVKFGGLSVGAVSFAGTTPSVKSLTVTVASGGPLALELSCTSDNGSWDVFLDSVKIYYEGPVPAPKPAPSVPSEPVWTSGSYRNLFKEWGKTDAEIDAKVNDAFNQLFYGTDSQKIYYEMASDSSKAYIYTADTNDVRSEGVSYGMMFCVQMNKQTEFNKLWKFAKTHMQHQTGAKTGYFAWQVRTDGTIIDANSAADGEEYFAMALYFASKRWGNGTGIFNYQAEADTILNHMVRHREIMGLQPWDGSSENMIAMNNSNGRKTAKQVVFTPYGSSADHTDPSYHLPAFYELWALWAPRDNALFREMAAESRLLFRNAAHPATGLAPDYSEFDGRPTGGQHAEFRYDAFRVAMNIAIDSIWWNKDSWQRNTWNDNYLGFFEGKGVSSYKALYAIDGSNPSGDHSPGLVAMNATAALISNDARAWLFVEDLWNITPTTGTYRYYDGCLYMFGMLAVSGKYQIWGRDGGTVIPDPQPPVPPPPPVETIPATPAQLALTVVSATQINLSWTDASQNEAGFKIERSTNGSSWNQIALAGANVTTYQNTGLAAATLYYYRIRSTNAAGDSPYSSVLSARTNSTPVSSGTWDKREAEACVLQNVTVISADGAQAVRFKGGSTSYISLTVNFDKAPQRVDIRVRDPKYGGNIYLKTGSPNGQTFATIYPDGNGNWHLKSNSTWPRPTGTQTVYIMSNNPDIELNFFQFIP